VVGRAGVVAHPNREGLQIRGLDGALRSSPVGSSFCLRASTTAARRARPRPGCWPPRRGPASLRRLGERVMAPPRSTRRATSCSVLSVWPQSPLPPPAEGRFVARRSGDCPSLSVPALKHPDSSTARLCSDGGHPGGQGSGERGSVAQPKGAKVPSDRPAFETTANWAAFGPGGPPDRFEPEQHDVARFSGAGRRRDGSGCVLPSGRKIEGDG
jgi:hypothetical protein